jgi:hypothetical protein
MSSTDREAHGWATTRGLRPELLTAPTPSATTSITDSLVTARARVVDLAAWKRLRGRPDGGDWFGGRRLWTWDEAERSWGWSA